MQVPCPLCFIPVSFSSPWLNLALKMLDVPCIFPVAYSLAMGAIALDLGFWQMALNVDRTDQNCLYGFSHFVVVCVSFDYVDCFTLAFSVHHCLSRLALGILCEFFYMEHLILLPYWRAEIEILLFVVGHSMLPISWTEMQCVKTHAKELRKVANKQDVKIQWTTGESGMNVQSDIIVCVCSCNWVKPISQRMSKL